MFEKDLRADKACGIDSTMEPDINHGGDSRIANQDENQQLPASNVSVFGSRQGGGNAGECIWLWLPGTILTFIPVPKVHGGFEEERSEQPDRNTTEREHEDHGPNVQQHSEATSEPTSGADQDSGDADDPARSGKSRGELCSAYTAIRTDRY